MLMAVVMMAHTLRDRHNASMCNLAYHMLELDRGVINAEALMQAAFHIAKNSLTDGGRNVGDGDMAGKRVRLRTNAPDMQVVNVVDAFDRAYGGCDPVQLHSPRSSFEQDIQSLAHNAVSRPQN